ncbi:hypothetical protein M406DRAFT_58341 [Cryphonectria parasitica EP155]|uniref:Uncharacterized protein n=1 Tax=Cryphonectria parasitica (strain ATCC 38755 / EP155) TaxID=660469 RepID=A0A9P5CRG2_CRYP1|nr:uncharacterized protein M406DRAFT_58341 [Cryphonectria parasitica EP155]KAF3768213.1 hypothetical protein M406DRAFT_58341 [Cryphonectria parasitica EP155]
MLGGTPPPTTLPLKPPFRLAQATNAASQAQGQGGGCVQHLLNCGVSAPTPGP